MKELEEAAAFQERIRETGSYSTDPGAPRPALDRLLGRFDAWYYLRLMGILYSGHKFASRGEFDGKGWSAHSYAILKLIEACGGRIEVSGMEHPVRLGRPTVFIGNHMSMAEGFIFPVLLLHMNFFAPVGKESLLHYPIFGTMMRAVDPISVGRKNPRADLKSVVEQGTAFLAKGRSVILFPQATRSARFDPKGFNTLGVKLAKAAGAPVTPVAVKTDFQANGRWVKDIGPLDRSKTLHIRFGEPFAVDGTGKEANERIISFITACLDEWKD